MNTTNSLSLVKFAHRNGAGFFDTLKTRIDDYFTENKIDTFSNGSMKFKIVAIIASYFVPYTLLISGVGNISLWFFYPLWVLMGIGMVGIGCSVMHDSNHEAVFKNKSINKIFGKIIIFVGGYDVNWRLQHNILHHTYTNIEGLDHDLEAGPMLRFSPQTPAKKIHRFQHIYAWFLYGLLTVQWATIKDFKQVIQYDKLGLLRKEKLTMKKALWQVVLYKIIYYTFILVIPMLCCHAAWYHFIIGFFIMHFIAGFSLSSIFQLAHVMEDCDFPQPNEQGKMENSWAIHQLMTTANFAPASRIMSWFIGGLNHQVEHHLFPYICHIHYKNIAPIVKQTALEFGIPYFEQPTLLMALSTHARTLKKMGRN